MKVLIIEDEHLTAERIITLLHEIDPGMEIMAVLDSVKSAVQWFRKMEKPDLIFMDIQLADGLSFDIFEKVKIDYPVIFITAYQQYAIKAFKLTSVDYLLKPVSKGELETAIAKYRNLFARKMDIPPIDAELLNCIRTMMNQTHKSRFMVKVGEKIRSLETQNILYFQSIEKGTYLTTDEGKTYAIDYSLETLEGILDPKSFFRINRSFIIHYSAIKEMISISGNKLKLRISHSGDDDIFVSRERLGMFKGWLG